MIQDIKEDNKEIAINLKEQLITEEKIANQV